MANQLWCIDFLTPSTPLIIPHRQLPSLNLLCHSKTDARFTQDAPKAVKSIPYISLAFFPSLKQNFIAYRSSKVSECIFEIHQLWQSGFSRVYSNYCCSCWFELEIIRIGQSSHRMYSNKILSFQESTTILNAHTRKKSGNLSYAPRTYHHNGVTDRSFNHTGQTGAKKKSWIRFFTALASFRYVCDFILFSVCFLSFNFLKLATAGCEEYINNGLGGRMWRINLWRYGIFFYFSF